MDPTHEAQLQALLKTLHSRIQRLEEQRLALDQTLAELRSIELRTMEAWEGNKTARAQCTDRGQGSVSGDVPP